MIRLFAVIGFLFRLVKYAWLALWTLYQLVLGALLVGAIWLALQIADYFHLGEIRALRHRPPESTAFIDAERRQLLDSLNRSQERGAKAPDTAILWSWIPLDSVPKTFIELVLVAEDAKFHIHEGFDWEQIEYAIVANHQAGRQARGASTITQQVAKNLFLGGEKQMQRKLREAGIALLLEEILGKDRILELYLNIARDCLNAVNGLRRPLGSLLLEKAVNEAGQRHHTVFNGDADILRYNFRFPIELT